MAIINEKSLKKVTNENKSENGASKKKERRPSPINKKQILPE